MKKFTPPYTAQGDLNIWQCNQIPDDLKQTKPDSSGQFILAHSETMHHHVIDGSAVRVFDQDEFVSFLDVKEKSNVVHLRSFDTHETIELPVGKYKITRQREYTPEGFRRAAD